MVLALWLLDKNLDHLVVKLFNEKKIYFFENLLIKMMIFFYPLGCSDTELPSFFGFLRLVKF